MSSDKVKKIFGDRKRFTPDSFKSGWMADLPDEDKEFLMHGDCDPEEFFADCDADSITQLLNKEQSGKYLQSCSRSRSHM